MTLLMCAASLGNSLLVQLLLEAGERMPLSAALTKRSVQAATLAHSWSRARKHAKKLVRSCVVRHRRASDTRCCVLSGCCVQGRLQELLPRRTKNSSTLSPWCWTTLTLTRSCGVVAPPLPGPCHTVMTSQTPAASGTELGMRRPTGTQQTRFALHASCLLALLHCSYCQKGIGPPLAGCRVEARRLQTAGPRPPLPMATSQTRMVGCCSGNRSEQPAALLISASSRGFCAPGLSHACNGCCADPSSPMGWMSSWLYDDAGPRFQCLLLLLRHGASLSREQLAKLHVILKACTGTYEASCLCSTVVDPAACCAGVHCLPACLMVACRPGDAAVPVQEGDALAKLVRKRVKACEHCQAYGCWKQCACKLSW